MPQHWNQAHVSSVGHFQQPLDISGLIGLLEKLGRIIDFEAFRQTLVAALAYGDVAKGGHPPYDQVAILKVLVLAAQNNGSDARMEYLICDRLSWLRFLGFDLSAATPDTKTIRLFRAKLIEAGALDRVFTDPDRQLKGRVTTAHLLSRYKPSRQRAILSALAIENEPKLRDAVLEMADQIIGSCFTRGGSCRSVARAPRGGCARAYRQ